MRFQIGWSDGPLSIYGTAGETLVGSPSVNTWYYIEVEFDAGTDMARARVSTDDITFGNWTSWVTASGGSFTEINKVSLTTESGSWNSYWDDIRPATTEEPPGGGGGATTTTASTTALQAQFYFSSIVFMGIIIFMFGLLTSFVLFKTFKMV